MEYAKRIRPAAWLVREQINALSRLDLQMVVVALATRLDRPLVQTGEAVFTDLSDLGFPCEQVTIRRGRKGIGVVAAYVARFNNGDTVVLFAKEGRNLSLKDRNDIRASFEEEMKGRLNE